MTAVLGPPGKRVVTGHVHLPGRSDAVERYRARRLAQLARDAGTKRAHRRTAPEAATHPCCRGGSASTPQHSNLDQHRESSLWQRLLGRLRILVATVEPTPQPRKDRTPVPARPADTSITPLSADHHSPGSRR